MISRCSVSLVVLQSLLAVQFISLNAAAAASQSYVLKDSVGGADFFDYFTFFTGSDPTHGFVNYLSETAATAAGLITTSATSAIFRVDSTNKITDGSGRPSVRLEGRKSYTHGLFIADIQHMPGGFCGTWPAFWTLGSGNWPVNGEIDILEGVNDASTNLFSLHTSDDCSVSPQVQVADLLTDNCAVPVSTSGCGANATSTNTYGNPFNSNGGGVYAMQWTSEAIRIWFFPRGDIPDALSTDSPDVTQFGEPQAYFKGSCDIDAHFKEHHIIFDTTFCGDWAGNVFADSGCPQIQGANSIDSCVGFVANNPAAFTEAYWEVNSIKIYGEAAGKAPSSLAGGEALSSSNTPASGKESSATNERPNPRPSSGVSPINNDTPADTMGDPSETWTVTSGRSSPTEIEPSSQLEFASSSSTTRTHRRSKPVTSVDGGAAAFQSPSTPLPWPSVPPAVSYHKPTWSRPWGNWWQHAAADRVVVDESPCENSGALPTSNA